MTARRTKQDFAVCLHEMVETHWPKAQKIRVVLDNLNTHTAPAHYKRYPPEQARPLVKKLEFHYTPKHSSWLNMAEVVAWENDRNERQATLDWRFTISNARDRLKKLYPVPEVL